MAGKRSRFDTCRISFRKTGIHFSGKCSKPPASRLAGAIVVVFGMLAAAGSGAAAADKFQKLTGSQIRSRIAGMEITDEVHWADVYGGTGTITSRSMGRTRRGKWFVEEDELCVDLGEASSSGCYEVWLSGNKVQLRRNGSDSLPVEGVLQKPSAGR